MCSISNIPSYDHEKLISSILKSMLLEEWADHKIKQLSGGMQRRIAITMALINYKTKLIILDEPSTGLDPQTKRIIWQNIKNAARIPRLSPIITGTFNDYKIYRMKEDLPGLILTSHDMNELNTICDTIQIMSAGQIVASGTSLELKRKFGSGFTLGVISTNSQEMKRF